MGQASPQPIVMITSEDWAVAYSSLFGVWSVMSTPTSRMAWTAAGLTVSAGAEPAERTSIRSPARWRSQPAAICERPALCTQTNRTLGLSDMAPSSLAGRPGYVGASDVRGGAAGPERLGGRQRRLGRGRGGRRAEGGGAARARVHDGT